MILFWMLEKVIELWVLNFLMLQNIYRWTDFYLLSMNYQKHRIICLQMTANTLQKTSSKILRASFATGTLDQVLS